MRVLVVDDHPLVLEGMKPVLAQLDAGADIVTAGSLAEAHTALGDGRSYALALLDLHLPDAEGITALGSLRARFPQLPIVVISASDTLGDAQAALDHGALGFVPKFTPAREIVDAQRLVIGGGVYIPRALVSSATTPSSDPVKPRSCAVGQTGLTARQADVLRLLSEGLSNKEIATSLGCTVATVKAHVTAVLRVLGVSNRTQAARVGADSARLGNGR